MRIDDERVREVESGERPGTVLTRRQHDRDGRAGGQRSVVGPERKRIASKQKSHPPRRGSTAGARMSVTGLAQERPSGEAWGAGSPEWTMVQTLFFMKS